MNGGARERAGPGRAGGGRGRRRGGAPDTGRAPAEHTPRTREGDVRILVAEDDAKLADMLARSLREAATSTA